MTGKSANRIRWGIISTAEIGTKKVIPGIMASPHSEVTAISSRNLETARATADRLGIPKAYGSYEEMLADPEIDAVYNPLPNHLHVDLTLAAARAGKHVLCEKPVALNVADAQRLRQCPDHIMVAEAFMVRYHPQWKRAREIALSGELGTVVAINGFFSYHNTDPANVRNQADIGGGAIMDIGCYPVTAARFIFDAEPVRLVSLIDRDPGFKTDRLASVIADFGGGRQLAFTVGMQIVPSQRIEIIGEKGRVEIIVPFNAPQNQPTALLVDDGFSLDGSLARREIIPQCDQYTEQAEAFALAVLNNQPLSWGIEDAIKSMKVLDAIFASEKSGAWENV